MPSIVVFGATGFVGVKHCVTGRPSQTANDRCEVPTIKALKATHPSWFVTAYVRPSRSAAEVKLELGVDRVETGDFSDFEKIKSLSKEHDVAFNAGSSFTPDVVTAIVAGFKEKPGTSKGKLIHISGSCNFIDFGTTGEFNAESKVWNDDNEDDIKGITKTMFNGPSDTVVLEAGKDNSVETYMVCFPVTYGGVAVGAPGIGVGYSLITGNAKPLGYVPYVGDGSAVLSTLHLGDAIPFLIKMFERAMEGPAEGTAYSRYYILETVRVTWKGVATELAKVMFENGSFSSPEPKQVSMDQAGQGEVKHLVASNMLVKGDRAARMGFMATHPSILMQMHEDLKSTKL